MRGLRPFAVDTAPPASLKARPGEAGVACRCIYDSGNIMVKRDNDYYEARLLRDHPTTHAAFMAGSFRSLRAACISVGLIKPRSRGSELKNAYLKATPAERTAFIGYLQQIGACGPSPVPATISTPSPRPPRSPAPATGPRTAKTPSKKRLPFAIAVDGRLTSLAKTRILENMNKKGLIGSRGQYRTGPVMRELGPAFSSLDPSLGMALHRDTALTDAMLEALEIWILDNS